VRRRDFIAGLAGAGSWPFAARAQQSTMPVVGFLHPGSFAMNRYNVAGFYRGLAEAGYIEGESVKVEFRWADNQLGRLPMLAADLVESRVAVIVAAGAIASVHAAQTATTTIPIVLVGIGNPIKLGLIASLNRPGGNVTGMTLVDSGLQGKRLDLLLQMVPQGTRVAFLAGPSASLMFEEQTGEVRQAAQALGCDILVLESRGEFGIETAFDILVRGRASALLVGAFPWLSERRRKILTLAAQHKTPGMYPVSAFALDGGLMSYGVGRDVFRQIGFHYVGQILKGAKANDLPVQQPNKFEFLINLKTARTLGLEIPDKLLALADEVIE
jgi:ABC-type uncharacterized transport system substrate-binding protein